MQLFQGRFRKTTVRGCAVFDRVSRRSVAESWNRRRDGVNRAGQPGPKRRTAAKSQALRRGLGKASSTDGRRPGSAAAGRGLNPPVRVERVVLSDHRARLRLVLINHCNRHNRTNPHKARRRHKPEILQASLRRDLPSKIRCAWQLRRDPQRHAARRPGLAQRRLFRTVIVSRCRCFVSLARDHCRKRRPT